MVKQLLTSRVVVTFCIQNKIIQNDKLVSLFHPSGELLDRYQQIFTDFDHDALADSILVIHFESSPKDKKYYNVSRPQRVISGPLIVSDNTQEYCYL